MSKKSKQPISVFLDCHPRHFLQN